MKIHNWICRGKLSREKAFEFRFSATFSSVGSTRTYFWLISQQPKQSLPPPLHCALWQVALFIDRLKGRLDTPAMVLISRAAKIICYSAFDSSFAGSCQSPARQTDRLTNTLSPPSPCPQKRTAWRRYLNILRLFYLDAAEAALMSVRFLCACFCSASSFSCFLYFPLFLFRFSHFAVML